MKYISEFKKQKLEKRWDIEIDLNNFKLHHFSSKTVKKYHCKCKNCKREFYQVLRSSRSLSCRECFPISHNSSVGELELFKIFQTTKLKVLHNDRKVLNGKELDIYLPDLNFAIEYDGKYWHNQQKDAIKDEMCKELNIKLYRVDNDDFRKDRELVLENIKKFFNYDFQFDLDKVKDMFCCSDNSSKIICLQNLKVYRSYKATAKDLNIKQVSAGNILNVCNGTFASYRGYTFRYYDENEKYEKIPMAETCYKFKRVKCLETGIVYRGLNAAKKATGISTIFDCVSKKQKTAGGLHWEYTQEEVTKNIPHTILKKIVKCSNGKTYNSLQEAADDTKIYKEGIARCCRNEIKQTHGLKFWYEIKRIEVDNKDKFTNLKKTIICTETKEEFSSGVELAQELGVSKVAVYSAIKKGTMCKGKHYQYK